MIEKVGKGVISLGKENLIMMMNWTEYIITVVPPVLCYI